MLMLRRSTLLAFALTVTALAGLSAGAAGAADPAVTLPPPVDRKVDFHKDVAPILIASCANCHAGGKAEGGFAFDDRAMLLAGGDTGAAVEVGDSAGSRLIELVAGVDPDMVMPAKGPRLKPEQVGVLRAWIDQGLGWEEGFKFSARHPRAALPPRTVALPPAAHEGENPLDRLLRPYYAEHEVEAGPPVDDRTYARRVWFDTIGLPPDPAALAAFEADASPDKRRQLVRTLLADRRNYAEHWLTFWNDALRNDYAGTGYIDGGRKQITAWLYQALQNNVPFDEFVRQLVNPNPDTEGFLNGIVWRGVVNASQVPPMQAAQNLSQVFLGINLKCASCHDSFVNDWKLKDSYALAGVFAEDKLEMHRCDQPTGEHAQVAFLFPELGTINGAAPRPERLASLATAMTSPQNGRLTRTMVNRLWARFLGRGLIEPTDEMDIPPWSADLLDWLAVDLAEHDYDLQHTMETILTSQAYQRASVPATDGRKADFVFHGPVVKRISAEALIDSVARLTAKSYEKRAAPLPDSVPSDGLVRASLVTADGLQRALGRPNREQVITERPTAATTLEMLELTNGTALADWLHAGAEHWAQKQLPAEGLVEAVYLQALNRAPTPSERQAASELVGATPTTEGVEDLLWAVVMLPEFQLIR